MKLGYILGFVVLLTLTSSFWFHPTGAAKLEGETSIERVSLITGGIEGPGGESGNISADGRYVVFLAPSPLVPEDVNTYIDAYVYDRQSQTVELVSIGSSGTIGNHHISYPRISADGRYVTFASFATNLVPNDTNNARDIFLRDRQLGSTERISVASDGTQANNISLWGAPLSADGRYVAFVSRASNLVPNDTNSRFDVFVRDRLLNQTTRVSVASDGTQGNQESGATTAPNISADGKFVTFTSAATNLVPIATTNTLKVFVHDRLSGETTLESINSAGTPANNRSQVSDISDDGRFITFQSDASNLVPNDTNQLEDIFLRDRLTQEVALISHGYDGSGANRRSLSPWISDDGQFIAFQSHANNLVPNDGNECDIGDEDCGETYLYDRLAGVNQRISWGINGSESNGHVSRPNSISPDGRYIVFTSDASNIVLGDTNNYFDVFLYDQGAPVVLTPTPTVTRTPTHTATPSNTPLPTNTPTVTLTPSQTATANATPSVTNTPNPQATLTVTASATATYTPTASATTVATYTATPTGTVAATLTSTRSVMPSLTPSGTAEATIAASATAKPQITMTATATQSPPNATLYLPLIWVE